MNGETPYPSVQSSGAIRGKTLRTVRRRAMLGVSVKSIFCALAVSVMLVSNVASAGGDELRIEGESGLPLDILVPCTFDDEQMTAFADHMFFPEQGCSALYLLGAGLGLSVTGARVRLGGMSDVMCGSLVFAGAVVGSAGPFCAGPAVWLDVDAAVSSGIGEFTVTWAPEFPGTPSWVNVDLDYLVVA